MTIKKKADNNWEYCVYIGQDENGKKKYKRKCGFKTRKACIEEASTFEAEKIKNKEYGKTFKEVCDLFLTDCIRRGLKQSTLVTYRLQIKFFLENLDVSNNYITKISVDDINEFINLKTSMFQGIFKRRIVEFLKYIFTYAKKNKLTEHNIFDEISLPYAKPMPKNIWSETDIKNYLPILKNFKYYDMVFLVLETGLRRGEVCALTWDCVDFDKGIININKSYTIHGDFAGISTPKTNSSIRQIALLDESKKLLKKRYKTKISRYVFPSENNINIPVNPICVSNSFRRFLYRNDIKHIRFHDLRHIHATLLLNKNINYKILSKRLGHSNVSFTLQTYTHVISDYEIQLFQNLSSIF